MNEGFNLSEWAIRRQSLIVFLVLLSAIAGVISYINLGRDEDPEFTFKTMIVSAAWPGGTIEQTTDQITDRLERTLEEVPRSRQSAQPDNGRPVRHLCDARRFDTARSGRGILVSGPQEGRRHTGDAAGRRARIGSFLAQRRGDPTKQRERGVEVVYLISAAGGVVLLVVSLLGLGEPASKGR